jgi:hypothetical protein
MTKTYITISFLNSLIWIFCGLLIATGIAPQPTDYKLNTVMVILFLIIGILFFFKTYFLKKLEKITTIKTQNYYSNYLITEICITITITSLALIALVTIVHRVYCERLTVFD